MGLSGPAEPDDRSQRQYLTAPVWKDECRDIFRPEVPLNFLFFEPRRKAEKELVGWVGLGYPGFEFSLVSTTSLEATGE